jgi:hypothetical protein
MTRLTVGYKIEFLPNGSHGRIAAVYPGCALIHTDNGAKFTAREDELRVLAVQDDGTVDRALVLDDGAIAARAKRLEETFRRDRARSLPLPCRTLFILIPPRFAEARKVRPAGLDLKGRAAKASRASSVKAATDRAIAASKSRAEADK